MGKIRTDQPFINITLSKRILAFLLDTLIIYLFLYLFRKAFLSSAELDLNMQIKNNIMNGLLLSFYSILFKGQTLGKRLMRIELVGQNDQKLDLMSLLNREIFGKVFIEKMNLWILFLLSFTGLLENIQVKMVDDPLYFILWYVISLPWITFISFTMLVNSKEQQSLHDLISGSKVVEKEYEINKKSKVQY